jgi:hypothetical protein
MACFLLRGPTGERWMPEQEPYRLLPDEAIVPGMIRWDCGPNQCADQQAEWATYPFRKCSNCGELGVYEST